MLKTTISAVMIVTGLTCSTAAAQDDNSGPALYRRYCAQCHENPGTSTAPSRDSLGQRTPEAIEAQHNELVDHRQVAQEKP